MRKIYLFALFAVATVVMYAQQPVITLTAEVDGNSRTLEFAASVAGTKLQIDWGDGILVETESIPEYDGWTTAPVSGIPVGEGIIKVYGENINYLDCTSRIDNAKITAVDLTNAVDLVELFINTNNLVSLDLSKNVKLEKLVCSNNPITDLNLSANTALKSLDAQNMSLTSIDLSHNVSLTSMNVNGNQIGSIDLSANTALKSMYALNCGLTAIDLSANTALTYVSLNNNKLTSLDVSNLEKLGTLMCLGNDLTELKVGTIKTRLTCNDNRLTFATLPSSTVKNYAYAPQKPMEIDARVPVNGTIDLSAQTNIQGLAAEPQATVFTWKTTDGQVLVAGEDYMEENGNFTFLKTQAAPVYCEMTSAAFPSFTGVNAFKTTEVMIENGTGIEANEKAVVKVMNVDGMVKVAGLAEGDNVTVYNVAGVKTAQASARGTVVELPLSSGIYVVTVNGKTYKTVVK